MFNGLSSFFHTWVGPAPAREEQARRTRVLVPVSGGPNAPAALGVLPGLATREHEVVFLHVRRPGTSPARGLLESALDRVAGLAHVEARESVAEDVPGELIDATDGFDLLVLGASGNGRPVSDPRLLDVVRRSACPSIVVRAQRGSRRINREGPRALVVAESSPAGMLGLDRALRYAKAGSISQEILLVPAMKSVRERDPERRRLDLRRFASRSVRVAPRALDAGGVLAETEWTPHELLVLACDPEDLLGEETTWLDTVAEQAASSVVCVFASRTGPRTRRHRVLVTA
jgi:hypothetical protein